MITFYTYRNPETEKHLCLDLDGETQNIDDMLTAPSIETLPTLGDFMAPYCYRVCKWTQELV